MSHARLILARAQERAHRRPSLEAALLCGEELRYFFHRARWLVPRLLLRTGLHGLELWLLGAFLPFELLGPFFILKGISLLLSSAHYGFLESHRREQRTLLLDGQRGEANARARGWLQVSLSIGAHVVALGLAYWLLGLDGLDGFSDYDAFAVALSLRFVAESVVRVLHGTASASARVPRTALSLIWPEVIEPLALLFFFPWCGLWAFSFATLIGGTGRIAAQLPFILAQLRRQHRHPGIGRGRAVQLPTWRSFISGLGGAIGNLSTQLEPLLIVILVFAGQFSLLPVLYIARPPLAALVGVARTTYFDLSQLGARLPGFLLARLEGFQLRFAALAGLGAGAALTIISFLQLHYAASRDFGLVWRLSLALGWTLFAIGRAVLSQKQVRELALGSGLALLLRSLLALLLLTGIAFIPLSLPAILALCGLALILAAALPGAPVHRPPQPPDDLPDFLARLSRRERGTRLLLLEVHPRDLARGKVLRLLQSHAEFSLSLALGRRRILLAIDDDELIRAQLFRRASGSLRTIAEGSGASGASAFACSPFPPPLDHAELLSSITHTAPDELLRERVETSGGLWLSVTNGRLPPETPRGILSPLLHKQRAPRKGTHHFHFWPSGEAPRALVGLPRRAPREQRDALEGLLFRTSPREGHD